MAGGGAPEVRAGPRLSLCSVPAAYSRRRGRGWGRWGPLRLCVVGAACSLVITAGCISGGCGAWWLAAALLMTARSAPSVRPFRAGHLQPPSRPLMGPPGSSHLRFVGVSCSLGRRLVVSQQHHGRSGVSPGPLLSAPPHPAREGGAWRLGEAPPAKPAAGGPEPPDFPTLQKNGPDSDSTHTQNERRVAQICPRVCPHAIHGTRTPFGHRERTWGVTKIGPGDDGLVQAPGGSSQSWRIERPSQAKCNGVGRLERGNLWLSWSCRGDHGRPRAGGLWGLEEPPHSAETPAGLHMLGPCRLGVPWTKGRRRGPRDVTSQRELVEKRVGEGVSRAPPPKVVGPENRTQDLRSRSQSL